MKKIAIILFFAFTACRTANTADNMFKIPSYTGDQKVNQLDTVKHNAGDVVVFRVLAEDTMYYTRMYRKDGDEVRLYEATIMNNILYDKAGYQWLNDSTVAFQLLASKTNNWYRFQLTGSGPTTTLRDDY